MRTVLSNRDEVAHFWANQTQPHGRASNFRFEGVNLYSYGTAIARIIEVGKTRHAVFDQHRFSPSTGQQMSSAMRAATHLDSWVVMRGRRGQGGDTFIPVPDDVKFKLGEVRAAFTLAHRGSYKSTVWRLEKLVEQVSQLREFARVFKLGRVHIPRDIERGLTPEAIAEAKERERLKDIERQTPEYLAKRDANAARRAELKEAAAVEMRQRHHAEQIGKLGRWLQGENIYPPGGLDQIYLRVKPSDPDRVQTTWNAEVTLRSAVVLYRLAQRCKAQALPMDLGEKMTVGPYPCRLIDADGNAQVGCHHLKFAEMERLALSIGEHRLTDAVTVRTTSEQETADAMRAMANTFSFMNRQP